MSYEDGVVLLSAGRSVSHYLWEGHGDYCSGEKREVRGFEEHAVIDVDGEMDKLLTRRASRSRTKEAGGKV